MTLGESDITDPQRGAASLRTAEHLLLEGRVQEALPFFELSLQCDGRLIDALPSRVLLRLHRPRAALQACERALRQNPADFDELVRRGNALRDLGEMEEALVSYRRALGARSDHAVARFNLASALMELQRYEQALPELGRLLQLAPGYRYALGAWFHCKLHCCDWDRYGDIVAELRRQVRSGIPADRPFQFLSVSSSAAEQLLCARQWAVARCPASLQPLAAEPYAHDRIRLAYLSADFHTHATAHLIAGMLEAHDRRRFEVLAISYGPDEDSPMRTRLRGAVDRFVEVRGESTHAIACALRRMEVDIAVDLKGYTGHSRPEILALRPAPIQVSFLGYPGTCGTAAIDYIIADRTVLPPEHQRHYSEAVVYLPRCYQVNDASRPVASAPQPRGAVGLPEGAFVFCCLNSCYKVTPDLFAVWMRLLRCVKHGVLWLLEGNATAKRNLQAACAAAGVDPARLIFAPMVDLNAHLSRYQLADLALDTLPVNSHTTASDALWAGVPLLTSLGDSFAGRVAGSMLTAMGLPELVAPDIATYEATALRLARDPAALSALRERLASCRRSASLFDTAGFTRDLEDAYVDMWNRHRSGQKPLGLA